MLVTRIIVFFLTIYSTFYAASSFGQYQDSRYKKRKKSTYTKQNKKTKKRIINREDLLEDSDLENPVKFFPNWPTPKFNYGAAPIIGMKYQVDSDENSTSRTVQSEIGLMGYVSGIGLWPGNPGLYLKPELGYVWGRVDGETDVAGESQATKIDETYQRSWGGVTFTVPIHFYRHQTQIKVGRKVFEKTSSNNLYSFTLVNDFGVLILDWLSTHFTHTLLQTMQKKFSATPFSEEQDYWLHTRLFTDFLNFYADFGPGFTLIDRTFNQDSANERQVNGRVDYLLLKSGLNPFWKLYLAGHIKYVYDSDEQEIGSDAGTRLPDQDLYDAPIVAMPKDSLYASAVIGVDRLIGGLGVGWRYNVQILNMSEQNNTQRERTEDNGLIVSYSLSL